MNRTASPLYFWFVFAVTVFVGELFVTLLYHGMGTHFWMGLADALILIALTIPIIYFLAYRPLCRELQVRAINEKRYRLLFEKGGAMMMLLDCETGRIEDVNSPACAFYGYSREDFLDMNINQIIALDTDQNIKELLNMKSGMLKPLYFRHRLAGGEIRDVEVFRNMFNFDGKNLSLSLIIDITEGKRAEAERSRLIAELEQSNKELENFAYIASHDLREPLRKVSTFGQMLEQSLQGRLDEDEQENLGFMIDGTRRLQAIIDDLLTYSRLTTEAKPFQAVDLDKILDEVENYYLFAKLQETGGTILRPKPLPTIRGDEFQIKQLMQNLLDNALKYAKPDVQPLITIEYKSERDGRVRISVKDNGIGIDPRYHGIIFNMFKRLHGREKYEGTGLGLAICKKIVERHQGKIGIDSITGEGASFWFVIPLAVTRNKI